MKYLSVALLISALTTPLAASANERLFLQVPAMLDPSASIPTAVNNECPPEAPLGNYALSEIEKRIGSVQSVANPEQAGDGKVIQLTIISVYAPGGGTWSGRKSMRVRADIMERGAIVDSTVLSRRSWGAGVLPSGTCEVLDRVARALGKDLAVWLSRRSTAQPTGSDSKVAEPSDESESPLPPNDE